MAVMVTLAAVCRLVALLSLAGLSGGISPIGSKLEYPVCCRRVRAFGSFISFDGDKLIPRGPNPGNGCT